MQKELFSTFVAGEMAEWSIAPVLKTGVLRGTGGSNPSLSAETTNPKIKTLTFNELGFSVFF